MGINRRLSLILCSIFIVLFFPVMRANAQTEEKWTVVDNTQVCTSCKESVVACKYCTNCGTKIETSNLWLMSYKFVFSDIIEKYNLKIQTRHYTLSNPPALKVTKETVAKFEYYINLTRSYCDREGCDYIAMISKVMFYKGVTLLGIPISIHWTEVFY